MSDINLTVDSTTDLALSVLNSNAVSLSLSESEAINLSIDSLSGINLINSTENINLSLALIGEQGASPFGLFTESSISSTSYYGGQKLDGTWIINKWVSLVKTQATQTVNPSYTNLNDAWANRLTLTYS